MPTNFQVQSPIDGSIIAERAYATENEIENALAVAKKAQPDWKRRSVAERIAFCEKALWYFLDHSAEIGEELSRQMGRPIRYASMEITKGFQERARYMMGQAEQALSDIDIEHSNTSRRFIRREPHGTVLVLAPWNYPYLTSVNTVIPAILAGNTVILKHAQQTPLCAERYAAAFESAGLPEGVFQFLHLNHEQVAKVLGDDRIAHVAFTGSVEGGRAVQQAISRRFLAAGMELGGKDPAYVRADARLDFAVENLVDGAFFNSGQSCCGIERIYVQEPLFDAFVEGFVKLTKKYRLGNPLDPETTLGPMVRTSAAELVQKQIREALQKGARAHIDVGLFSEHRDGSPYLAPQVLTGVDHSMQIMIEETFGPVVGIMPVRDDAEALRLMNDSRYGLTASVWTQDPEAALQLGDQIETGTCFMNRCDYLDPALAWTGVKDTGRGCTLSTLGFEALTRPKSFHFKL